MKTYGLFLLLIFAFLLTIPVLAQDSDNDGFPDAQDTCPNQPAPNSTNGCRPVLTDVPDDSDGDGMIDTYDQCPNDGGPASNTGCPENTTPEPQIGTNDSDGDGFPDEQDACPNQAGSAGGCDLVVIEEEGDCVAATKGGFRANIRENASENAVIIGQLLPNQTKLILAINVSNNNPQNPSIWVQVDIGFINTSVIRIGGDCSDLVSDDEGEPTMTATFALEYDCSTTPRVVIISDETPTGYYMGQIGTYAPWWVYPDVLYSERPLPTEPHIVVPGNIIIGTPCDDLIIGTDNADIIDGLGGNDMIIGLRGHDALVGNEGNDQLLGMTLPPLGAESNGNILIGGNGNDVLNAASNVAVERLDGGAGDDTLLGTGNDNLRGGNDNDRLTGGNFATGGAGNDTITGTTADDRLYGNSGEDRIEGSRGHDTLDGGDDRDWLYGSFGNDMLTGGGGNDFIQAHLGSDQVFGGEGDDIIEFYWGGLDVGEGQNGNDRIDIRALTFESFRPLTREEFESERGGMVDGIGFSGGNGNDTIIDDYGYWEGFYVPLKGDDGDDYIVGGSFLGGGLGNDTLYLRQTGGIADGGDGDDRISAVPYLFGAVLMYGGNGNDRITGHENEDLIFGGDGNDNILGMAGQDYIDGGNGDDSISGGPNIVAGTRRDSYRDSINYVVGGAGRDTIDGGPNREGDTCPRDSADTVIGCEITSWPNTMIALVLWDDDFAEFGIRP